LQGFEPLIIQPIAQRYTTELSLILYWNGKDEKSAYRFLVGKLLINREKCVERMSNVLNWLSIVFYGGFLLTTDVIIFRNIGLQGLFGSTTVVQNYYLPINV
jgi:hypothetical protein